MKKRLLIAIMCLISGTVAAQIDPVTWSHEVRETSTPDVYEVTFTAAIRPPWHMYDLGPYTGGPNATEFTFTETPGVKLLGPLVQKTAPRRIYDAIFQMELGYFEATAVFIRPVEVTGESPVEWPVSVSYQLCDDQSCLAPTDWDFTVSLPAAKKPKPVEAAVGTVEPAEPIVPEPVVEETPSSAVVPEPEEQNVAPVAPAPQKNLWRTLLAAIGWGLAAFLTPCVFPMAPMTVSFFLKGHGGKKRGRFMAAMYGLFIVLLYTLPVGVLIGITYFVGGEYVTAGIFNWLATHWLPNTIFFAVFLLFAASFFGAFELRVPSKWVNGADGKADKGDLSGLFFMALTLVLVSFSCTGPIVSSVLLESTRGGIWEPVVTMLAFSLAFALPFTVLAFFPALLKNLPRSGGWLNAVKVTLGFIEIALALKFLSIADQTYHWGILDREVYLAVWIVVFTLLGLYLMGKIKFKHDGDVIYISIFRLASIIAVFSFVVCLIPGMWGAPLKALSGYLPPMHTQDFVVGRAAPAERMAVKHGDLFSLPHGLNGFFDYAEGMAYAKAVGKPVFIDITGHGCVNCREMEARVWSSPRVLRLLREEYVIIALYVDDKTRLPENEWVTDSRGKTLKTLGRVNAEFALERFGTNAQPYYVLLDNDGRQLTAPRAYDLHVPAFVEFLENGLKNYRK